METCSICGGRLTFVSIQGPPADAYYIYAVCETCRKSGPAVRDMNSYKLLSSSGEAARRYNDGDATDDLRDASERANAAWQRQCQEMQAWFRERGDAAGAEMWRRKAR